MKFLFSPLGLIIIVVLALIIFLPRRLPDKAKKFGKPMRAFPEDPPSAAKGDSQPGVGADGPKPPESTGPGSDEG